MTTEEVCGSLVKGHKNIRDHRVRDAAFADFEDDYGEKRRHDGALML